MPCESYQKGTALSLYFYQKGQRCTYFLRAESVESRLPRRVFNSSAATYEGARLFLMLRLIQLHMKIWEVLSKYSFFQPVGVDHSLRRSTVLMCSLKYLSDGYLTVGDEWQYMLTSKRLSNAKTTRESRAREGSMLPIISENPATHDLNIWIPGGDTFSVTIRDSGELEIHNLKSLYASTRSVEETERSTPDVE